MSWALLADRLVEPYDEGIKNITIHLAGQLHARHGVDPVLEHACARLPGASVVPLGRTFLVPDLARLFRRRGTKVILYVPATSMTPAALLRANLLRVLAPRAKVVGVAVQMRSWSAAAKAVARAARMEGIVVLSERMRADLGFLGRWSEVFTLGVDTRKFAPPAPEEKSRLRAEYGIPEQEFVVLHVGHIKASRNLEMLSGAVRSARASFLVVGSGTTRAETEEATLAALGQAQTRVVQGTSDRIQEYFRMADCYAFPVAVRTGATEMPLSVLEAMACNLPVVTSRYGRLPELFREERDSGFVFADDAEGFSRAIELFRHRNCARTRILVEPFSWENSVDDLEARLQARLASPGRAAESGARRAAGMPPGAREHP